MPQLEDLATPESGLELLLPRLRDGGYGAEQVARRREWVEERTGARLAHIGGAATDTETLRGNIENLVGMAQVPVGVAGPLLIHGQHARGVFYVPLATTEGALLRSYERGMMALTRSGGVQTALLVDRNQTAPSFFFDDVEAAAAFEPWMRARFADFQEVVAGTSRHGRLEDMHFYQMGRQVIVNFGFATGDAHGMNMIVKATDAVCRFVSRHYDRNLSYFLFSGMCSEKRASGFVASRGKGKRVTAGALLPTAVIKSYLHTTPDALFRIWQSTVMGHLQAGAIGYSAHAANGLTALFIATGQDVANIPNSALALTCFEPHRDGLYVSTTLPALTVATVGGGTGLATPREALAMMDCAGSGKARKLAEIAAGMVLAGEISMGAAIASHEFVAAHEHYGRNRPR